MSYLDKTGLTYFWGKCKAKFAPANVFATVTLTVTGWTNKTQTVTVNGVTSNNTVLVNNSAGIKCTAQTSNKLTFTCETVPTANVTVNVAILS